MEGENVKMTLFHRVMYPIVANEIDEIINVLSK